MSARIDRLTTGQYHQVIALTQYMINLGLENLYKAKGFEDPKKKPYQIKTLGNGFSNLKLGPPSIIIETLDDNHTNVFYRVHMKSGNFVTALDGPDGGTPGESDLASVKYVVNDWYFAFPVDLAQIILEDKDPRKEDALKTMKRAMGKYTVQQLMVNMKTARISNTENQITSFGVWTDKDNNLNGAGEPMNQHKIQPGQPRDWTAEPEGVKGTFNFIISRVIEQLTNADLQNLGITAQAIDAGRVSVTDAGHPPTFMPVDCRFQMYPWKDLNDPNYKEYNGIEGNGRFNYLLYLEMTGNKDGTVPEIVDKGRYLEEIGNWTDGRNPGKDPSSKFGTFMLTEKKFLEEFLLPKFDKMNRMVKIDLSDLKAEVYTKGLYSYFPRDIQLAIGAGVHAGPDDGDAQYRFQKIPAPKDMSFPTQLPSDALKWYWTFIDDEMKAHNSDRYLNFGYKAEHWGEAKSYTGTRLSIVPGSNQIKFEGTSSSRIYWEWDFDVVPNGKAELVCKASWSLTITMAEVSDGGLQLQIDAPAPEVIFSGANCNDLSSYRTYMQDSYNQAGHNFAAITNSLKNSLEGQERFFLPASGTYFFKNPIFNHQGALLCELEYNGNSELETPNGDASAREATGNTKVEAMPSAVSDLTTANEKNKG